jgi:hypothetical protein
MEKPSRRNLFDDDDSDPDNIRGGYQPSQEEPAKIDEPVTKVLDYEDEYVPEQVAQVEQPYIPA